MFTFLEWFVLTHLKSMRWPRRRGLLRVMSVDIFLADSLIESGLMLLVGLGAGRPELAVRLFTMFLRENTFEQSLEDLLNSLLPPVDDPLGRDGVLPWRELVKSLHPVTQLEHASWDDYSSGPAVEARARVGLVALHYGLVVPDRMVSAFSLWWEEHKRMVEASRKYRLGHISPEGVDTLAGFYQHCEETVLEFGMKHPLPDVSNTLFNRPEIAARL